MNAEQLQDLKDIVENLAAVKGREFAVIVTLAGQARGLIGMIYGTDMDGDQKGKLMTAVSSTCSTMLAALVAAHNFDSDEIMQWADRLGGRIYNSIQE